MGTKKCRFEENPNERYDKMAPEAAAYACLSPVVGTSREIKLTGIVTTKHKRNLSTETETPIVAAIESMSRSVMVLD